jgi:hypothetical protein
MDQLTGGEHVITVFSKAYFESKWCMFELLKTFQKGAFAERTHPIIADGCSFQDQEFRLEMVKYWKSKHEKSQANVAGLDPAVVIEEHRLVALYRDIYQNINEIMNFAADRVMYKLSDLQAAAYAPLLDKINTKEAESDFLEQIKTCIANELSPPKVAVFTDRLRLELNTVLVTLHGNGGELLENHPAKISEALVWTMVMGKDQVPVFNRILKNAYMHCFDRQRGLSYAQAQPEHHTIKTAVEQIVGWLVLASVNKDTFPKITPEASVAGGLYFELPVETLGGIEIIVSRKQQRPAKLDSSGGSETIAKHITCVAPNQLSWHDGATVDEIKKRLWNKIFPGEVQETALTPTQTRKLNAELQTRRLDDWDRECHCVAIQFCNPAEEQAYNGALKKLLAELDQLTLVRYGVEGKFSCFYMLEHSLMQAVNSFIKTINRVG